jgi:hypothetical protein
MRLPYCILGVLGDVLDDGELYFVEAAQTIDAAKARVKALAEVRLLPLLNRNAQSFLIYHMI